jgi:hypothetical protein
LEQQVRARQLVFAGDGNLDIPVTPVEEAFMVRFSESTMSVFLDRFRDIAPDTKPLWGKMTPPQMLGHVNSAVRYSMGYGPDLPFKGNWKTRFLFAPLILNGFKQIPHNIRVPRARDAQSNDPVTGDLDTLEASLHELLTMAGNGGFRPPYHPFFGTIGPNGWMKFHGVHMDHHLRQFGA